MSDRYRSVCVYDEIGCGLSEGPNRMCVLGTRVYWYVSTSQPVTSSVEERGCGMTGCKGKGKGVGLESRHIGKPNQRTLLYPLAMISAYNICCQQLSIQP